MKLAVIQMSDLHITSGTDYIVEVTNFAHLLHTKKGGHRWRRPQWVYLFCRNIL